MYIQSYDNEWTIIKIELHIFGIKFQENQCFKFFQI